MVSITINLQQIIHICHVNLPTEDQEPPIDEVVRLGAVPRLVEFLKLDDNQHFQVHSFLCCSVSLVFLQHSELLNYILYFLQVEAARVLKNIGTGSTENAKVMVDCGAVPLLVKLTHQVTMSRSRFDYHLCILGVCNASLSCFDSSYLITIKYLLTHSAWLHQLAGFVCVREYSS